jgi:AcrR family transcriptional regulator
VSRPASYDVDSFLDAAADLVAASGPAAVTMTAVARAAGASSGSIYHRFADRSTLLAALWLRTLGRFHIGLLAALGTDPPVEAAPLAARHVVDWACDHPAEARVLLAGASAFGSAEWPQSARDEAAAAQSTLEAAVRRLARRMHATSAEDYERLVLAVVDLPYAVVRRHLSSNRPLRPSVADLVQRTAQQLLAGATS